MYKKCHELKTNELTLLLTGKYDGNFDFEGLYINNNPNIIYKKYVWSEHKTDKLKSISDVINNKLQQIVNKELQDYIEQNINNRRFYNSKDFWDMHYRFTTEKFEDKLNISNIDYSQAIEGVFECKIERSCTFTYNILTDTITQIAGKNDNKLLTSIFCQGELNRMIAKKHYENGVGHPAYIELLKLNSFLEGKKSIKYFMNDNSIHELKEERIYISRIIRFKDNNFTLENNYSLKPRLKDTDFINLKCLQYGKQQHVINTDNLQLDITD